jgi:hypothetical protein
MQIMLNGTAPRRQRTQQVTTLFDLYDPPGTARGTDPDTSHQAAARVRRKELVRLGYIDDAGIRRPAPSGSNAIVWKINANGIAQATRDAA